MCHSLNLVFCDIANSCPKSYIFIWRLLQRKYTLFSFLTKKGEKFYKIIHITLKSF